MSDGIPCLWMRGGTSKGAYFNASDIPQDKAARKKERQNAKVHGPPPMGPHGSPPVHGSPPMVVLDGVVNTRIGNLLVGIMVILQMTLCGTL